MWKIKSDGLTTTSAAPAAASAAVVRIAPAAPAAPSTIIKVIYIGLSKFSFGQWYAYHNCHNNQYRCAEYLFIYIQ
jgi:spore germination cell wall hydrolase CwlJ-like protein